MINYTLEESVKILRMIFDMSGLKKSKFVKQIGISVPLFNHYIDEHKPTKPGLAAILGIKQVYDIDLKKDDYTTIISKLQKVQPTQNITLPEPIINIKKETAGIYYIAIESRQEYLQLYVNENMHNFNTKALKKIYLPTLPVDAENFRVFEMKGDSMLPAFEHKAQLICERVPEHEWPTLPSYYSFVLVTETAIEKAVVLPLSEDVWLLHFLNQDYFPQRKFEVKNLKQLWRIVSKINFTPSTPFKFTPNNEI
jgi:hypothetical protein